MELNKEQKEAIEHENGPLLMVAGAGSGKTRALTSRLKALIERGTPPSRILAITFTNKAADEMRERVFGKIGAKKAKTQNSSMLPLEGMPFIGTFHALGLRIVKQNLNYFGRHPGVSIVDDDDAASMVRGILKEMDLPKEKYKPLLVLNRISRIKSELMNPQKLEESDQEKDHILHALYLRYEAALLKNNAFDFDDLIEKPVRLFTKHPNILKKYQELFDYVLVDEYQDINTAQYQLVRLLAQAHGNISVVGDDAQAIYSFRGADFRNFLNFSTEWPNAKVVKLEQNYRSTKNIIEAAGALIANNTLQTPKKLWTENEPGERVKMIAAGENDTEATWVASEITELVYQNPEATIAVLYRTNAQSRAIEQALISQNLPYHIFGGLKFYARKEIRDIVAALRIALNPVDTTSAERLRKSLGKRLSAPLIESISQMQEKSILEIINFFLAKSNYAEILATKTKNPQERLENIAELVQFASEFKTLEEFLDRISLLEASERPSGKSQQHAQIKNPVRLMTIHIAKGLEFDYVFVIGINEGVLPHQKSMLAKNEVEEERRLLYVAMTRAKKQLYLLFHSFPSRFLYEIPRELCEFISPSGFLEWLPDEDDMYLE